MSKSLLWRKTCHPTHSDLGSTRISQDVSIGSKYGRKFNFVQREQHWARLGSNLGSILKLEIRRCKLAVRKSHATRDGDAILVISTAGSGAVVSVKLHADVGGFGDGFHTEYFFIACVMSLGWRHHQGWANVWLFSPVETAQAIEIKSSRCSMWDGATSARFILAASRKELGEKICDRGLQGWKTGAYDPCIGFNRRPNGGDESSIGWVGAFGGVVESCQAQDWRRTDAITNKQRRLTQGGMTYKLPKPKTMNRPHFWRRGSCKEYTDLSGKTKVAKSPKILATALAYQNAVKLIQVPWILRSQ